MYKLWATLHYLAYDSYSVPRHKATETKAYMNMIPYNTVSLLRTKIHDTYRIKLCHSKNSNHSLLKQAYKGSTGMCVYFMKAANDKNSITTTITTTVSIVINAVKVWHRSST
jgi:hypothetical protein